MAGSVIGQNKFSTENALDESCEDAIRVYGSTTERSPLKTKERILENEYDDSVWVETTGQQQQHQTYSDGTSKDNDSLIRYGGSECEYDPSEPCWKHPKIRENWKVVLAATALVIIGLSLFSVGILLATTSGLHGLVFFIAGVICFIPGAYHVVYIYFAVKGKRGYYFYHLPLFN